MSEEFFVVVEFEFKGHKITANAKASSVDDGVKEIKAQHPGCKILSAYRSTSPYLKKKRPNW